MRFIINDNLMILSYHTSLNQDFINYIVSIIHLLVIFTPFHINKIYIYI